MYYAGPLSVSSTHWLTYSECMLSFSTHRFERGCPKAAMSSKMQSSGSIAQARRTVQQLRLEASIERIKVRLCFQGPLKLSVPPLLRARRGVFSARVDFSCRCPRPRRTSCATAGSTPRTTRCSWASPPPKTPSRTRSHALFCRGSWTELALRFISMVVILLTTCIKAKRSPDYFFTCLLQIDKD